MKLNYRKKIKLQVVIQNDVDGMFVSGKSSFIITDDLKVSLDSTGLVNRLGCSDVSKLGEQFLDIGLKEVSIYYCVVLHFQNMI